MVVLKVSLSSVSKQKKAATKPSLVPTVISWDDISLSKEPSPRNKDLLKLSMKNPKPSSLVTYHSEPKLTLLDNSSQAVATLSMLVSPKLMAKYNFTLSLSFLSITHVFPLKLTLFLFSPIRAEVSVMLNFPTKLVSNKLWRKLVNKLTVDQSKLTSLLQENVKVATVVASVVTEVAAVVSVAAEVVLVVVVR